MAQQLPRYLQQGSWMRVWSKAGAGGGGRGMSMRCVSAFMSPPAVAAMSFRGLVSPSCSKSLLILSRPSSSSSCPRIARSVGSSGERLRIARAGIAGKSFEDGFRVSVKGFERLPLLSPILTRRFSSAEASALADGFLKESLAKEGEEKSVAAAAAVGEVDEKALQSEEEVEADAGAPLEIVSAMEKVKDEVKEIDTLVAEIQTKELELAELRSALRVVQQKVGVEVDGDNLASRVSPGFSEVDNFAGQASPPSLVSDSLNSNIDAALAKELALKSVTQVTENLEQEINSLAPTRVVGDDEVDLDPIPHPWPVWIEFLKQLEGGGYFVNDDNAGVDLNGSTNDDIGLIKRACLNFARDRDDIFLHYSRKDMEVIARFGCPCTDRKVVNSGKRLRDFLAIDEISVCQPCALRSSCERRDFKASADHVSGTPEVIRLLSQYALEVSPYAKEGRRIPSAVETACSNLLRESIALGAVPRDPSLPKIERSGDASVKIPGREREMKRKVRDTDVEMKPGDWKCDECQYVNFARNRTCRECDAFRPVPEMRPGDWRCPECNFVNFSRNDRCHDCKVDKPAGSGFQSSYDSGSRYDRGAPEDRGSRFDKGSRSDRGDRRSEVRSFDRGSERGSRDYDRGSDRYDSRGGDRESFGRSRERGAMERQSGRDDARGGGRRSSFEEWKPDLKRKDNFDEDERKSRKSALDMVDDDDDDDDEDEIDDLEFDSDDDEDISDVEPFQDEEFEDMKAVAPASRGRSDSGRDREVVRSRSGGRNGDRDPWSEDDRTFKSERGTRGGGNGGRGSRGGGRGGRGGARGDFGGRERSSSRDSRSSSYERSDRDSGRSYGRSDRSSDRPSRGRGGGRGGGGGRGRGRR